MIVIEVVDHLGRVKERHKFSANTIRAGRAYNNDIVLSDPFVCANHIEIESCEDGTLLVRDLDSVNGLYKYGGKGKVKSLQLADKEKMRIGHTFLRYRNPQNPIAPTREDRLSTELLSNLLNSSTMFWLSYLLLALFVGLASYLGSYSEFKMLELFRSELLPYALVLLLWAGFWSLLSRITTHSFYFKAHSIIACATLFVSLLYDEFIDAWLRFAFNWDVLVDQFSLLFSLLVITIAFYAHLRFCSVQSARRLFIYSLIIASFIIGITYMQAYEDEDYFSSYPVYHDVILPPSYQIVGDSSFEEFFTEVEMLDDSLKAQIAGRKNLTR